MANKRRLNPIQEKKVISLYHDDKQSISFIMMEMGVSDFVVRGALHRDGRTLRPKGRGGLRAMSRKRANRAVQLYARGVGCDAVAEKFGVTSGAILRWVRTAGVKVRPKGFQRGEGHHAWNGGRSITEDGYVLVSLPPEDPFFPMVQANTGYVLEHRLVMAMSLGRLLTSKETVHHLNGDRANNAIDNLQLRQGKHGKGIVLRCADCGSHNVEPALLH